ncbi:MAG TPA: hypothetical protein VGR67_06000, partial [Candidatus Polarisedimenticolia bacterium]|nr:hypothetical protein [Candidatus Polarisedimenticolia bacterium]
MKKRGIPLGGALRQFSAPDEWEKLEQLRRTMSSAINEKMEAILKKDFSIDPSKSLRYMNAYSDLDRRLTSELLEKLKSGELSATGYFKGQPPQAGISLIPSQLWESLKPSFLKSTASGGGVEIVGIRVFENQPQTIKKEKDLQRWFKQKVTSNYRPSSKQRMFAEAQVAFGGELSERALHRTWKNNAPESWKRPGR